MKPDKIDLPGSPPRSFKWKSQRRYAVLGLDNNKPCVIKRSDTFAVCEKVFEQGHGFWLIDAEAPAPVVRQRSVTAAPEGTTLPSRPRRERRIPTPGAPCECGCGGATGGGRYLPGHDAKHKASLIELGLKNDAAALLLLEEKGWTKFLEKRKEIKNRPKPPPRARRSSGDPHIIDERFHPHWSDDSDLDEVWNKLRTAQEIKVQRTAGGITTLDTVRIGVDVPRHGFENSVRNLYQDGKEGDGPVVFDCFEYLYNSDSKSGVRGWRTSGQRTFRISEVVSVR